MSWQTALKTAARAAPAKAEAPGEHPMIVKLLLAATAFSKRTDAFAQGKESTCRDMALKLARFGDFASDKQREFAEKLVTWSQPREAKPAAEAVTLPRLFAVLQKHSTFHAGSLRISRRNGDTLCWLMWEGVCIGKLDNAVLTLFAARVKSPAAILATLREFEAAPLETAMKYGKLSGTCCSCGLELTNPESIEMGLGPICRKKFM